VLVKIRNHNVTLAIVLYQGDMPYNTITVNYK